MKIVDGQVMCLRQRAGPDLIDTPGSGEGLMSLLGWDS